MLHSEKTHALDLKFLTDQFVEIDGAGDHVAPRRSRRRFRKLQRRAQRLENFRREKRNLPLIIALEIEIAVASNAAAGDAFNFIPLNHGVVIRLATVMPDEVVSTGNVQVTDFHRRQQYLKSTPMKESLSVGLGRIIRRKRDGALEYLQDDLTIEEPLEICVGRKTLAVTMRTPGHDEELAAGFLLSEAIVNGRNALSKISMPHRNKVNVELAGGMKPRLNAAQRFGAISSSCGLCGKTSMEAIRQSFPAIGSRSARLAVETLLSLPGKLREAQGDFSRTGGLHAAGIFNMNGELKIAREDIGRHNAVDKAIGRALLEGWLPLNSHILLVSGRASFEIMQKALAAGIPVVAAVSAPSSLAVEFARATNQTLIGFLRPPSFNLYTHIERVLLS